jgi:serine/threonine-protein kinase
MPVTSAGERCPRCGNELPGQAVFCPSCGNATPTGAVGERAEPVPASDSATQSATRELLVAVLGQDYLLGELLGRGGFAEVYAAFDRRLKRRVAVKVLREELRGDAAVRERFRREAEVVARLRHPHVVPIYAVGEAQDLAYFVMPLLEGQTLAAALETEGRWSFPEVCRILREAASALSEAHRAGLIHRDVKPENIFLDGPDRRVVIMDFGIAKAVDEQASHLTATGMLVGSPQFMSPEQAAGDRVDALSDQYSLALVGYRMLSGQLPFEADSLRALLYKQATEQPPPLENLRPDIPASLDAMVTRALAKERAQRFPTMGEFETALTRVASEVAGDFRRRRTVPPPAERWAAALSEVYDRPWRWVAALVGGLLLFGYAYPRSESRGAREALGARDGAIAAARLALHSLGATQPTETVYRNSANDLFRFLQEAEGSIAAESTAASAGVWYWEVQRYRREPYEWSYATADARGRLLAMSTYVADSIPRPSISGDSALRLSLWFARRLGFDSMAFGAARRSERLLVARRDYGFTWTPPSALPKRGRDSVAVTLSVGVVGDRVERFSQYRDVPKASTFELSATAAALVGNLAGGVVAVLLFVALGIAAKRAAFDTIQWGAAFRLAVLFLVVHTATFILPSIPVLATPLFSAENVATITGHVSFGFATPALLAPALMLLVLLSATESLLNEARPELVAGLTDVSRLRLRTPEVLRALPAGIGLGALLAAGRAAASLAGRFWLHLPVESWTSIPRASADSRWPWIGVLSEVWLVVMAFTLVSFLVAVAIRARRSWLAPLGAVLLWTGLTVTVREPSVVVWQALLDGIVVGAVAVVVLRRGLLASGVALFVATGMPIVYDLLWAGGPFRTAGVEGLLLLLFPAALGVIIFRQRPHSLPSATPPPHLGA